MKRLVLTVIGPDRHGLVEALARRVAACGGNWEASQMVRLSGRFAGVLVVRVPVERAAELHAALVELEGDGLQVGLDDSEVPSSEERPQHVLELIGNDRPGIVAQIAQVLARHEVNVDELYTECEAAPMSGELLFRMRAMIHIPAGGDADGVRRGLEALANELMVDLTIG